MAKKVEVEIDVKSNLDGSIQQLKELKKQLKQTAAGSDEFKKLYNQIDDLEDKIKGAKKGSADWIDTLESAGGPIGALGAGLNKLKVSTQSFGTALKATGIGLIVALLGGLIAAFSETEGSMKKLEPLMIAMEQIFGGILEALQPLIDGFIELAIQVMPYVTKAFKVVYSAVTAVFQSLGKLGSAIVKLFKGDFAGAWEDAKTSVTGFTDNYEAATERFEAGAKKMTKTQKANLKEQKDASDKALQEKLKRMEAEDKIDEARLEKLKAETLLLATTEQQKLDIEKAFAEKSYKQKQKDLQDKQALYSKDSVEYKNLQAELLKLDADYTTQLTGFKDKQKEITDKAKKDEFDAAKNTLDIKKAQGMEESAYQKELYDLRVKYATDAKELGEAELDFENYKKEQRKKSLEEQRGIALIELQSKIDELDRKNQLVEGDYQQDLERLKEKRDLINQEEQIELQNTELTEFQKTEIRKKYSDQRAAITTAEIQTEKAAMEAKHAINMAYLGLFEQFGNVLGQLAGKNKAVAIAGIVISQAAAIGQIIANTGLANIKAVAASPLTFGQPWVAINTISAGLSIASTVAAAAKSISQINSAAASAGVEGGGGGTAASAQAPPPVYSGAPASTATPQINTATQNNPTSQIAQTLASTTKKPIQAYVISSEVSSQQALDRRTNRAATFSGG
jgi:hypothetical protein